VARHPDTWIEIAVANPATGEMDYARHFPATDLVAAADFAEEVNRKGVNVYVGVALRRGETEPHGRASEEHVITSAYGWDDFDADGDAARVKNRLYEHDVNAHFAVVTGTIPNPRFHVYVGLIGNITPETLRSANEAIHTMLQGVDNVQNPAHALRLAGCVNYPTPKKIERGYVPELITIESANWKPTYAVSQLTERAGPSRKKRGRRPSIPPMPEELQHLIQNYEGRLIDITDTDVPLADFLLEHCVHPDHCKQEQRSAVADIIYGMFGPDGQDRWRQWITSATHYNRRKVGSIWQARCRKGGYWTIGSLIHWAKEIDPDWSRRWDEHQSPPHIVSDGLPNETEDVQPVETTKPKPVIQSGYKPYIAIRASNVIPKAMDWLWEGRLLRGGLSLLTGLPGIGKSQLQCDMVARVTTGQEWPDRYPGCKPSNVIMVTAEDVLDQTIVPRLIAANADLDRITFLQAIKKDRKERMFLLSEDMVAMEQLIRDTDDVGLVTLDPITAFMGKINSHQNTDVRDQLGPLQKLAEKTNIAFSAITHPAKAASQKAIDHFIGSQAFIAAARVGNLCVEELDDEKNPTGRILFADAKRNLTVKMSTLAYRIEQLTVGQDQKTGASIVAPHVVWSEDVVAITADQAVAAGSEPRDGAIGVLKELLSSGEWVPVKTIEEHAKGNGLTINQMRRAKDKLGRKIQTKKLGVQEGWAWRMSRPAPTEAVVGVRDEDIPF
jgi:hypothetical protein